MAGLGWIGAAAAGLGLGAIVFLQLASPKSQLRRLYERYVLHLEHYFALLFVAMPVRQAACLHLGAVTFVLLLAVVLPSLTLGMLVPVLALAPSIVLSQRRFKKLLDIDAQLSVWLVALSNALKASASIGDALRVSVGLTPQPLAGELELVLKEVALGVPLDDALAAAAKRIDTPTFASCVTTLVIARQTGGNLPVILEGAAGTLREMERLEGVVRSQTAQAKSQAYVLAALPFVVTGALHSIDPGWIDQITGSFIGWMVLAGAAVLWAGSLAVSRKVLAVDI